MAIPVYLTHEDEDGKIVKGASEVSGREGTIEILELMHCVILPTYRRPDRGHHRCTNTYPLCGNERA